jgi:LuxR family maltose regulon positive regulatory protein
VSGFPIQPSKVQRPPLRDDVLSRPRLNDQLDAKSSHRVVLLVAEAGYGKTTLLADWTRRTSRRVAWYRLDTDDRDWLTFLHHLLAAGRAVDDRFGFEVEAQLESLGPDGPTREQIVATLARELSATSAEGLTVVLDDYHVVDDNEDVRDVLRGLVERVTDGVSFLISTRIEPALPLSRFRARAEVAEFAAHDLRFDEAET